MAKKPSVDERLDALEATVSDLKKRLDPDPPKMRQPENDATLKSCLRRGQFDDTSLAHSGAVADVDHKTR